MQQQTEDRPHCFGKMYDSGAVECMGGHDPAYSDPETGSRIRKRCGFVSPCSIRMQADRNAARPGFVPAQNIVRPPGYPPPTRPPWAPPIVHPQQQQWQGDQHQHNQHPANYYTPTYLTVRQPMVEGQSMGKRLAIEAFRSVLKSLGHSISHFFDNEIFGATPPKE